MDIYVVYGIVSTTDDRDYSWYNVKAFTHELDAKMYVTELEFALKKWYEDTEGMGISERAKVDFDDSLDPNFSSYSPTSVYEYEKIDLVK